MAWADTNNMVRQNISRMAENLGAMKQGQAGRMQQGRMQREQLRHESEQNRKSRIYDALKTAGTMAGDYFAKNKLAQNEEDRRKASVGEGGWQREYELAMMNEENRLRKDLVGYEDELRRAEQEWLYGKGGPRESYEIRAEGREAKARAKESTTAYSRQQDLLKQGVKNEKALIGARGKEERESFQSMYEPGSPYMTWLKEQPWHQAMGKAKAELWMLEQMRENPEKYGDPDADPNEDISIMISRYLSEAYMTKSAEYEAQGRELTREDFERELLRDLQADEAFLSQHGGQSFVEDVQEILPDYLDDYFPEGEEEGAGATPTAKGGLQALGESVITSRGPEAIPGATIGGILGGWPGKVIGGLFPGLGAGNAATTDPEENALETLQSAIKSLRGDDRKEVEGFIAEINRAGQSSEERLSQMITKAKALASQNQDTRWQSMGR